MSQTQSQPNTLDPEAVNLAKSIRQVESGDNFQQAGKSGEYGAYQFLPATWTEYSKEAGVNAPLNQATPEQQNEVAYKKIKQWKDQGYNVGQIASMWNAGPGKPNAYIQGNAGTNAEGVSYDTAAYAKRVAEAYQQLKGAQPAAPSPSASPQPQSSSILPNLGDIGHELGSNIANRFQEGSQALGMAGMGLASGDIGKALSGGIQTAGAVAGGVGDVLNAGLELIPGVQALEGGISGALGNFAKTDTGQSIIKGLNDFAQQHPEIAGDVGAAVNIASVIPMFKGLSLIKGGITDAATSALKGNLAEAAGNELKSNLTTQAARNSLASAERRGLNPIGLLTSDTANLPAIVEAAPNKFVYDGTKAAQNIQSSLSQDEDKLQTMLAQGIKKNIGVDLSHARQQTLKDVLQEFRGKPALGTDAVNAVNQYFDKVENYEKLTSGRNVVSIDELNNFKRELGGQVNWQNLGVKAGEIKSAIYRSFMSQVENYAKQAGVDGVHNLNKVMGNKLEALKVLKSVTGKSVKQSKFGKIIREIGADVAGGAGELAGTQAGIPFASTLAGRGLYKAIPGRVPLTATRLLGRNGRGTVASSLRQGLLKSGAAQGLRGLVQLPQQ